MDGPSSKSVAVVGRSASRRGLRIVEMGTDYPENTPTNPHNDLRQSFPNSDAEFPSDILI